MMVRTLMAIDSADMAIVVMFRKLTAHLAERVRR
jgi:hypothetical protein